MSIERLYDFETVIEDGVAALLTAAGLTAATVATNNASFQSARPRVEVQFATGAASQSRHKVGSNWRNAMWSGTLTLEIVTDSPIATHRTYRATVRSVMATAKESVSLQCHNIANIVESSTGQDYSPQDGYRKSTLTFEVTFGVDAGAWAGELP